jgi:hypothetical protein
MMDELVSPIQSQSNLFDKAAECDRLMNVETDQQGRIALCLLREMWIALASASPACPPNA